MSVNHCGTCSKCTPAQLRALLRYSKRTGRFKWRNPSVRQPQGWFRGSKGVRNYRRIWVLGHFHQAHIIAFALVKGRMPEHGLDHEDRNQSNNRWVNIRPATQFQNGKNRSIAKNNKTGVTGVRMQDGRFRATIMVGGKPMQLGMFATLAEATKVRKRAERKYYKEFAGE